VKKITEKIEIFQSSLDAYAPPWSPEPPSTTSAFNEYAP
jgi:hypothetical protein